MDPYEPLPPIMGQRYKFSSDRPYTASLINTYLPTASATIYTERLEHQQFQLSNPVKQSADKIARLAKKERRKKTKEKKKECVMSKRKAMEIGLWSFDKRLAKWDLFWPIHLMWIGYIAEVMGLKNRPEMLPTKEEVAKAALPNIGNMQAKILKADFHGCVIQVKECKNTSRVGCGGIVVHETSNAFKVVTRKNQLKVLPKQGTVFSFSLPLYAPSQHSQDTDPRLDFELYGNQFRFRASERAGKKFKAKETVEL